MRRTVILILVFLLPCLPLWGQSPTATIDGRVLDPGKAVIEGATIHAINVDTDLQHTTLTNSAGLFTIVNLPPGTYRIEVSKPGFRTIVNPSVVLHVQDVVALNFDLPVGSILESVTVTGGAPLVNTEDASVSTVVDRQFAENLPMNGRSFQTLIELTPGVVVTPSTYADSGQFSVNGQRASSNYWMVDGVSANIGVGVNTVGGAGNGISGALGSFSAQGGTNSLVSVDALQEFRIQTSTYAPEFGRTPGGQISIVTRSGTNQFHGSLFDYFRNDILDANDWFADFAGLPKPEERQNDFGGTFSGPILKDRTFFFFSYEGLRLRLPQTALSTVPDIAARQNALPALQPYLNAFPLPNGPDTPATGIAQFNASFSNKSTLDAYSLRIDHRLNSKWSVFGRYNYSPSENVQRGSVALSTVFPVLITTQTATTGAIWLPTSTVSNDLRFNYSRTSATSVATLDNFGGAVPLTALPLPSPFTAQNAVLNFVILSLTPSDVYEGVNGRNFQRQWNIVDSLSVQKGPHALKFGLDFRRLTPESNGRLYTQAPFFSDVPSAEAGNTLFGVLISGRRTKLTFRNLGVFAQDSWHLTSRLTLTYGLRWDVDFVPSSNPELPAVTGYNPDNFSNLALAPPGTAPFHTSYGSVAPRIGVAYQLSTSEKWQTVVRGGFGVFYDLADQEVGSQISQVSYPFGAVAFPSGSFPYDASTAQPPPIVVPGGGAGSFFAFDPHLRLPYTLQWNVAVEQALGRDQTLSVSTIGAAGRRLIQTDGLYPPNPNFSGASLIGNSATSDYDALQIQLKRRLSKGLQALVSETWSHSIDTGSASSFGNPANERVAGINPNANRGPSDFDIRNAFSAGVTYDLPDPKINPILDVVIHGWSLQSTVRARSAPPVDIFDGVFGDLLNNQTSVRPDLVPGQPLYVYGAQCVAALGAPCPGGTGFNPKAFVDPPTDSNGTPLRQGNLPRNALRGLGASEWDFAVHREFPIRESVRLQFRAEMFNVLNHPNFAQPSGDLSGSSGGPFGRSTQMLGRSLDQNAGGGSFSGLYQMGGPRSIQLALKLEF